MTACLPTLQMLALRTNTVRKLSFASPDLLVLSDYYPLPSFEADCSGVAGHRSSSAPAGSATLKLAGYKGMKGSI
jgi:hypothetical protein